MVARIDDNRLRLLLGRSVAGLAFVTWLLLIFGSTVRVNGAGLSCPDWPLCFGQIVPKFNVLVALEWGHRQLAGLIGTIFLVVAGLIASRPTLRREFGPHVLFVGVVLACQIILGGLPVLNLLAFWSVTLHLLFGNVFMAGLIALALRLRSPTLTATPLPHAARPVGIALSMAILVQLGLGGLVSSNFAGVVCTEWPTCNGGVWFPTFSGIVGLQLFHRLGGYTVAAIALAFTYVCRSDSALRVRSRLILALVATQIVLGIANVLLVMPVELAIAHAATAHAIVATAAYTLTGLSLRHHAMRPARVQPKLATEAG